MKKGRILDGYGDKRVGFSNLKNRRSSKTRSTTFSDTLNQNLANRRTSTDLVQSVSLQSRNFSSLHISGASIYSEGLVKFSNSQMCFANLATERLYICKFDDTGIQSFETEPSAKIRNIIVQESLIYVHYDDCRFEVFDPSLRYIDTYRKMSYRGDQYLHDVRYVKGHTQNITILKPDSIYEDVVYTAAMDGTIRIFVVNNSNVEGLLQSLVSASVFTVRQEERILRLEIQADVDESIVNGFMDLTWSHSNPDSSNFRLILIVTSMRSILVPIENIRSPPLKLEKVVEVPHDNPILDRVEVNNNSYILTPEALEVSGSVNVTLKLPGILAYKRLITSKDGLHVLCDPGVLCLYSFEGALIRRSDICQSIKSLSKIESISKGEDILFVLDGSISVVLYNKEKYSKELASIKHFLTRVLEPELVPKSDVFSSSDLPAYIKESKDGDLVVSRSFLKKQ